MDFFFFCIDKLLITLQVSSRWGFKTDCLIFDWYTILNLESKTVPGL